MYICDCGQPCDNPNGCDVCRGVDRNSLWDRIEVRDLEFEEAERRARVASGLDHPLSPWPKRS